jgi:hypothetical protein
LAVFLSFFTWLYTWRTDWPQFVVGATLHCVVAPVLFVLGAFVDLGSSSVEATLICAAIFVKVAVWVAAILDAAATPEGWYADYPNVPWWGWDYCGDVDKRQPDRGRHAFGSHGASVM